MTDFIGPREYDPMYDCIIDHDKPVAEWTLEQCEVYCAQADESYGEQRGEAGMGAMSLGYGQDGAYEAASAIPSPSSDPIYRECNARIEQARADRALVKVTRRNFPSDDIPF